MDYSFLEASFGIAVHRCPGSHLARMEMRLVYEAWHNRIPDYGLAPGAVPRVKWPRARSGLWYSRSPSPRRSLALLVEV